MKPHYLNLFLISFFLYGSISFAQQDVHLALYKYHSHIFNPAVFGSEEGTFLSTSYRSQWTGIKDAPRIQAISLGFPSGEKRAGYGLLVTNDQTFIEQQTRFFANYSYRLPLTEGNLYLGISAGGNNFSVNFNALDNLEAIGDSQFQNFSRFNPNVGLGVYLQKERFFLSLSIPQLLSTKRFKEGQGLVTSARDRPHFYAITGVDIPINDDWSWVSSGLFRYVSDAPLSAVVNTGASYRKLEMTVGYQINAGITGTFMIREMQNSGFALGYSYQVPTVGQLQTLTGGNHEILLRIRLAKTKTPQELIEEEAEDETLIGTKNRERKNGIGKKRK